MAAFIRSTIPTRSAVRSAWVRARRRVAARGCGAGGSRDGSWGALGTGAVTGAVTVLVSDRFNIGRPGERRSSGCHAIGDPKPPLLEVQYAVMVRRARTFRSADSSRRRGDPCQAALSGSAPRPRCATRPCARCHPVKARVEQRMIPFLRQRDLLRTIPGCRFGQRGSHHRFPPAGDPPPPSHACIETPTNSRIRSLVALAHGDNGRALHRYDELDPRRVEHGPFGKGRLS